MFIFYWMKAVPEFNGKCPATVTHMTKKMPKFVNPSFLVIHPGCFGFNPKCSVPGEKCQVRVEHPCVPPR